MTIGDDAQKYADALAKQQLRRLGLERMDLEELATECERLRQLLGEAAREE